MPSTFNTQTPEKSLSKPPTFQSEQTASAHYRDIDRQLLWHPFTQTSQWLAHEPLVVERGEGFHLVDADGRRYIDGVSSLWCNLFGHSREEFVEAGKKQVEELCHSTLLGLTNTAILDCTEQLFRVAPSYFDKVFYSDSGTGAVEAALRMALEYNFKTGESERTALASLQGAYHGDSLGAVGVGFLDFFHRALRHSVVQSHRVNPPHIYRYYEGMGEREALEASLKDLETFFEKEGANLAGFFVEPIVQGAAGIWVHPPEYLKRISELCKRNGVLLIVDEVATGFFKTGSLFAHQLAGVEPDFMVLGKAITAGHLPLSCVLTTEKIFSGFTGAPSEGKTFFYGQTYAGNPLAARFAAVSLKLIAESDEFENLDKKLLGFTGLVNKHLKALPCVEEVRQKGVMVAVELTAKEGERAPFSPDDNIGVKIVEEAKKLGLFIRPLGNAMILMPAPTMPEELLEELVLGTEKAIRKVCLS